MEKPEGLSILVFCYNSSWIIERNLERLLAQRSSYPFEILMIDNNSTDGTSRLADTCFKLHGFNAYKIIHEYNQGLSFARIAGLKQAAYRFCLFVDDDNLLVGDNWIDTLISLFQNHPQVGAIGCKSIGELPVQAPVWWGNPFTFCVGEQRNETGTFIPTHANDMLWGACLCFKTDDALYSWSVYPMLLTDRSGTVASAGGDVELGFRLAMMGYAFLYTNQLSFVHVMTQKRMTEGYLRAAVRGGSMVYPVMEMYRQLLLSKKINLSTIYFKTLLSSCIRFVLGLLSYLPMAKKALYFKLVVNRMGIEDWKGVWNHWQIVRSVKDKMADLPEKLTKYRDLKPASQ